MDFLRKMLGKFVTNSQDKVVMTEKDEELKNEIKIEAPALDNVIIKEDVEVKNEIKIEAPRNGQDEAPFLDNLSSQSLENLMNELDIPFELK